MKQQHPITATFDTIRRALEALDDQARLPRHVR
jgi:hypothetical protein